MPKRSKRYRKLASKVPADTVLNLEEAVGLLKDFAGTKFDQSVEACMCLGIDTRQADQQVRGAISLPAGTGKTLRIAVFARGENEAKAKEAGADFVGADDLAQKIKDGWTDFDMTIATPDMMGVVGPLGRVLGPRGLMPSPKNGTITTDVAKAVSEFKGGKIEYRADETGNVHALVGKLSFSAEDLEKNIRAFVNHIRSNRPSGAKGNFIRSITVSATMSPGLPVSV